MGERSSGIIDLVAAEHERAAARAAGLGRRLACSPVERVRTGAPPESLGCSVVVRQSFLFLKTGERPPAGWTVEE